MENKGAAAVALSCVAGLVWVIGHVHGVQPPVTGPGENQIHAEAQASLAMTLEEGQFRVGLPALNRVVVESPPTRAAQMRTAHALQAYLGLHVSPAFGLRVQVWRPDGRGLVSCVADGVRWQLEQDGPPYPKWPPLPGAMRRN